ncbi:MAG TPA: PEP-CTERM sorting domain-containing protein [Candidatus Hypogeohydataceae bacterium YC41]
MRRHSFTILMILMLSVFNGVAYATCVGAPDDFVYIQPVDDSVVTITPDPTPMEGVETGSLGRPDAFDGSTGDTTGFVPVDDSVVTITPDPMPVGGVETGSLGRPDAFDGSGGDTTGFVPIDDSVVTITPDPTPIDGVETGSLGEPDTFDGNTGDTTDLVDVGYTPPSDNLINLLCDAGNGMDVNAEPSQVIEDVNLDGAGLFDLGAGTPVDLTPFDTVDVTAWPGLIYSPLLLEAGNIHAMDTGSLANASFHDNGLAANNAVPEPCTLALLATGMGIAGLKRWRKIKKLSGNFERL